MDDRIFKELAAGYPMHMVWRVSLIDMWNEVERVLGGRVKFLTETERAAMGGAQ